MKVNICGIETETLVSFYDWVTKLSQCRNRVSLHDGRQLYGETTHEIDCQCDKCKNWNEADRLYAIFLEDAKTDNR